jgi:hypothetical protein
MKFFVQCTLSLELPCPSCIVCITIVFPPFHAISDLETLPPRETLCPRVFYIYC